MLFIFYDPRMLKIVNCRPPRLEEKTSSPGVVQKVGCVDFIQRNFMDADMMRTLSCFLRWLVYSAAPENPRTRIPRIKANEAGWLQHAAVEIGRGATATAYASNALGKRLPLVIKKAVSAMETENFTHEYAISMEGTNGLRSLCPNFCFTFALYQKESISRILLEKIPDSVALVQYVQSMTTLPFSTDRMDRFLRVFIQVVLSLEVAQETLFFTHFDLHGENVLVRKTDVVVPRLTYLIGDRVYTLRKVSEVATILDFGHATVRYKRGFIATPGGFPEYGMYPFYVPGADLFKLFTYLWLNLFSTKTHAQGSMGLVLSTFFKDLLENFYGVQTIDPSKPKYMNPKRLSDNFYNGTMLPSIFFSPYDLLQMLDRRRPEITSMLGIAAYPWTSAPISKSFVLYKTPLYMKDNTYRCIKSLFCQTVVTGEDPDLYRWTTVLEKPSLTKAEADIIFAKVVPTLDPSRRQEIDAFLQPVELWKRFLAYVNYKMTMSRRDKTTAFRTNMTPFLYFYRAYTCLLGYKSFLSKK
jgi:hypothetical protein